MASTEARSTTGVIVLLTVGIAAVASAIAAYMTLRNTEVRVPADLLERSRGDADHRPLDRLRRSEPAAERHRFGVQRAREYDGPRAASGGDTRVAVADSQNPADLAHRDTATLDEVQSMQPMMSPADGAVFAHRGTNYILAELEPTVWKVTDAHGWHIGTLTLIATGEEGGAVFVTGLPEGDRMSEGTDWPSLVAGLINQRVAEVDDPDDDVE